MPDQSITNTQDLQAEIVRLKIDCNQQGSAISFRFDGPMATFNAIQSLFKRPDSKEYDQHGDIFTLISRFLLPLTLNKTVFSQSNTLVKILVGVVSQKAAAFVNEDNLKKAIAEGKKLFETFIHKSNADEQV